jgi:hypothetical protein
VIPLGVGVRFLGVDKKNNIAFAICISKESELEREREREREKPDESRVTFVEQRVV